MVKKEYTVVIGSVCEEKSPDNQNAVVLNLNNFEAEVERYLSDGWEFVGGVSVAKRYAHPPEYVYSQAMTRSILKETEKTTDKRTPIAQVEMSVRLYNCLKELGEVIYLEQIADLTESVIRKTGYFGKKSLAELKEIMARYGVSFKSEE
jgi:hypothetical protein